ncbi:coiled-coil domain-containing protein 137 [Diachasma alloeum]|uniref:coiled-coil domain-containing protein 137 n=1 Tax=Diachasma alloeum TaxID=454923 RepID=UPI0007383508|nr:coiled-coil domain-containing protein 137 [Diachasma alloeum]
MGRKIPGKKHRGVKDPEKQRAQRWAELKTKVNNPPKDDEQIIPKSLQRVIKLKDDVKSGRIGVAKRKKRGKVKDKLIKIGGGGQSTKHPKGRPEKVVPVFNQMPNEKPHQFLNRVHRETQNFINETVFEKKYNVQVKRNAETGTIEGLEKSPKDEIDELMKLQKKHKNIGKKKRTTTEPKLSKSQKRMRKLEMKKASKLQENIDEFKQFREDIKFGDIVHAPPDLKVKPARIEKLKTKSGKPDLLLNSLLNKSPASKTTTPMDRTGKRKNLPSAERRILEKQQSEIVNAYRLMKAKKSLNHDLD